MFLLAEYGYRYAMRHRALDVTPWWIFALAQKVTKKPFTFPLEYAPNTSPNPRYEP